MIVPLRRTILYNGLAMKRIDLRIINENLYYESERFFKRKVR